MKMRTLIIDDESDAVDSLELIIDDFLPNLEVVGAFTDPRKALKRISVLKPELVFLDINMPGLTGFEFLEKVKSIDFEVVFTTAYDEYALKAFDFGAANYLLKPISIDNIKKAVKRIVDKKEAAKLENETKNADDNKISVSSVDGVHYIKPSEIVYLGADNAATIIHLKNKKQIHGKATLKDFETILAKDFIRIHHSSIININQVKKLIKSDQWYVEMNNGEILSIARRKRDGFLEAMESIANSSPDDLI